MKLTKAKILEIRKKAEFENAERVADQANNGRSAPFVNHNRAGLKEIRIEDVTGSVKWSYGKVTEKARRPRIEAKESRSIGPDHWRCHQDGFTIGTEPTDRGVNGEANQQVLWRLEKVERLAAVTGRRLTPERLLEQCKVMADGWLALAKTIAEFRDVEFCLVQQKKDDSESVWVRKHFAEMSEFRTEFGGRFKAVVSGL